MARKATKLADLLVHYDPRDITLQEIVNRIEEEINKIRYSLPFAEKIDLLFYINFSFSTLTGIGSS